MAYIVDADMNLEPHKKIIMKLSKKNIFFEDILYFFIYKKISLKDKKKIKKDLCYSEKQFLEHEKNHVDDISSLDKFVKESTHFIYIKKKVCGFITTEKSVEKPIMEITFLLIDKEHQNKGLGSKLLNYVKEQNLNIKIQIRSIQSQVKFYEKNNFISCNEQDEENYELMICRT